MRVSDGGRRVGDGESGLWQDVDGDRKYCGLNVKDREDYCRIPPTHSGKSMLKEWR